MITTVISNRTLTTSVLTLLQSRGHAVIRILPELKERNKETKRSAIVHSKQLDATENCAQNYRIRPMPIGCRRGIFEAKEAKEHRSCQCQQSPVRHNAKARLFSMPNLPVCFRSLAGYSAKKGALTVYPVPPIWL
jgi:hypothetical protein